MRDMTMNFRLNAAERRVFLLLAAGHVMFAVALLTLAERLGDYGLYAITPLFGLPLVLFGPRDRWRVRASVLLLGFALIHYAAVFFAGRSFRIPFSGQGFTDSLWIAGAIGGLVGAAGSLALCALGRMLRPASQAMLAIAVVALCLIGAVGVGLLFDRSDGPGASFRFFILYTPWQLAFAYFLAKLLRD